jgi:hypothetical protein
MVYAGADGTTITTSEGTYEYTQDNSALFRTYTPSAQDNYLISQITERVEIITNSDWDRSFAMHMRLQEMRTFTIEDPREYYIVNKVKTNWYRLLISDSYGMCKWQEALGAESLIPTP